jgi:urease accessory protein
MTGFFRGSLACLGLGLSLACFSLSFGLAPAQAHHLMELMGMPVNPLSGLLSGLAHPVIGPDHLLFLLALALVGLRSRRRWMLALLCTGLAGSVLGLLLPGLPGAEVLVALSLALEALVVLGRLPLISLVPAMALHGYVLSAAVLGWSPMPLAAYLMGLLISQGLLLLVSLSLLQGLADRLTTPTRRWLVLALVAACGAGALSALVG